MSKLTKHLPTIRLGSRLAVSGFLILTPFANGQVSEWFREGKPNLTLNPRYEYGKIDGLETSHAVTLKTLLGYTTADWQGFSGAIEFTDTRALDRNAYNAAGVHGPADHTPIADPQTTEVNQFFLAYTGAIGTGKIGRQRYILDNARFIGNVGWRQNEQTFDAVTARFSPLEPLTLNAGYLRRINRIFADEADWDAATYLFNARYAVTEQTAVSAYYYHQSFEGAVPTTDTAGGFLTGKAALRNEIALNYRLEAAYQEYTHAPIRTKYFHGILGLALSQVDLQLGYEVIGSDDGLGQFLTPLATAHAYNGFADAYLDNGGPGGLRDLYFSVGTKVGELSLTAAYHRFRSDHGNAADGKEFDLVAAYPLSKSLRALAKIALYEGDNRSDRERFIVQLTATY